MTSIRKWLDPGGRLARRVDQLVSSLQSLGERLRGAIADAVGQTLGGIVRDTALRVLADLPFHYLSERQSGFSSERDGGRQWRDYDEPPPRRDYREDAEPFPSEPDSEDVPAPSLTPPKRLATSVSAGMVATAWWLRRWSGRWLVLTSLAVVLLAGTIPPFVDAEAVNFRSYEMRQSLSESVTDIYFV